MNSGKLFIHDAKSYNMSKITLNHLAESNMPKVFNGLPVVRTAKELGRNTLTNKTIIIHKNEYKLSKCLNGYIVLSSTSGCRSIGSRINITCDKHFEPHKYCREIKI